MNAFTKTLSIITSVFIAVTTIFMIFVTNNVYEYTLAQRQEVINNYTATLSAKLLELDKSCESLAVNKEDGSSIEFISKNCVGKEPISE